MYALETMAPLTLQCQRHHQTVASSEDSGEYASYSYNIALSANHLLRSAALHDDGWFDFALLCWQRPADEINQRHY